MGNIKLYQTHFFWNPTPTPQISGSFQRLHQFAFLCSCYPNADIPLSVPVLHLLSSSGINPRQRKQLIGTRTRTCSSVTPRSRFRWMGMSFFREAVVILVCLHLRVSLLGWSLLWGNAVTKSWWRWESDTIVTLGLIAAGLLLYCFLAEEMSVFGK